MGIAEEGVSGGQGSDLGFPVKGPAFISETQEKVKLLPKDLLPLLAGKKGDLRAGVRDAVRAVPLLGGKGGASPVLQGFALKKGKDQLIALKIVGDKGEAVPGVLPDHIGPVCPIEGTHHCGLGTKSRGSHLSFPGFCGIIYTQA